jgi:hypothetical protein
LIEPRKFSFVSGTFAAPPPVVNLQMMKAWLVESSLAESNFSSGAAAPSNALPTHRAPHEILPSCKIDTGDVAMDTLECVRQNNAGPLTQSDCILIGRFFSLVAQVVNLRP